MRSPPSTISIPSQGVNIIARMLLSATLFCSAAVHAMEPEFLNPPGAADLGLPFSDAVRVGPWLFLSGKIGNRPGTRELAPGGISGETRQAMDNIQTTLERYGTTLDRVVKCTVFLADMGEWQAMNEVYVSYFPHHRPARSALGASGLALNARVEIECMAVMPDSAKSAP